MSNQKVGPDNESPLKKTRKKPSLGRKTRSALELSLLSTLYDELFGELDDLVERIDDASEKVPSKNDVEDIRKEFLALNKKLFTIQIIFGFQFILFLIYLTYQIFNN